MTRWASARASMALVVSVLLLGFIAGPVAADRADAQAATAVARAVAELVVESEVAVDFPVGIDIVSNIAWSDDFDDAQVELLYTVGGDETATLAFVPEGTVSDDGEMEVSATLELQAQFVPSGVSIEFWWRVVDERGTLAESKPERTDWFDTRWD